jgi:hypothetical protein
MFSWAIRGRGLPVSRSILAESADEQTDTNHVRTLPGNNTQNAAVKYKMKPRLHEKLSPLFPSGRAPCRKPTAFLHASQQVI